MESCFYSLVNMLVIVQNFRDGQKSYLSAVNMGCIVLADLYLLCIMSKMADEKRYYENRVKALEQQAKMQYEYYLAQTENIVRQYGYYMMWISISGLSRICMEQRGSIRLANMQRQSEVHWHH